MCFEKLGSFTSIYYDFVIIYFQKQAFFCTHTRLRNSVYFSNYLLCFWNSILKMNRRNIFLAPLSTQKKTQNKWLNHRLTTPEFGRQQGKTNSSNRIDTFSNSVFQRNSYSNLIFPVFVWCNCAVS